MSPRTGRPKAANPKSVEVKVRFTDSDNQRLLAESKAQGITRAETLREAVLLLLANEK